jgi:5-methylthioadenosine/S-adenosylhomocysteine deaminase
MMQRPPQPTIVASQRVVLGGGDEPISIEPACLELRDGSIAAVHRVEASRFVDRPPELALERSATLIDYGDRLVTPAFVNAHTHLALGFLRGADLTAACRGNMVEEFFFRVERALQPADVRAFACMGAYESLLAGVGLVWDHYYRGTEVAQALCDVGLAGVVAPTLQDLAGPGMDRWEAELEATERIDDNLALAARGVFAALGPHATDTVSAELFRRAVALAAARGLPLHAHLAQSIEEHQRCMERHGRSPAAWLDAIGVLSDAPAAVWAHAIYCSRDDLARLTAPRHALVFCPHSQLVFGFPAPVGVWSELGLSWAVATDCASNNDSMNVQKELRLVAGQRSLGATWSSAYRRFLDSGASEDARAAWSERARLYDAHAAMAQPEALLARLWSLPGALHPRFRAGVIAEGALANLVVWDLDHPALWPALDPLAAIAMADAPPAIWAMFVVGQRMGRDGDFARSILTSKRYLAALDEARWRLSAVRGRARV